MDKKHKKKTTKRKNMSKSEILFKMKCNEVAMKNVKAFMSGEVTLEDLMRKVYGVKPKEDSTLEETDNIKN